MSANMAYQKTQKKRKQAKGEPSTENSGEKATTEVQDAGQVVDESTVDIFIGKADCDYPVH
jgi:hypothetical protein